MLKSKPGSAGFLEFCEAADPPDDQGLAEQNLAEGDGHHDQVNAVRLNQGEDSAEEEGETGEEIERDEEILHF